MTPQEIAADLRSRAFNMEPMREQCSPTEPFGFINEFWQGSAVVTLAAFETGDVSLYFSTGGGILGGVGKPELAELARKVIGELGEIVPDLERTDETRIPEAGEFCFYVLTPSGRFAARAKATEMVARDGAVVKLVRLGGALITKVREVNQKTA